MATELIPIGTGAYASPDFVALAGAGVAVYLKDAAGPDIPANARVYVQIKDGAEYFTVEVLTGQKMSRIMAGGKTDTTYRLYRDAGSDAVGASYI